MSKLIKKTTILILLSLCLGLTFHLDSHAYMLNMPAPSSNASVSSTTSLSTHAMAHPTSSPSKCSGSTYPACGGSCVSGKNCIPDSSSRKCICSVACHLDSATNSCKGTCKGEHIQGDTSCVRVIDESTGDISCECKLNCKHCYALGCSGVCPDNEVCRTGNSGCNCVKLCKYSAPSCGGECSDISQECKSKQSPWDPKETICICEKKSTKCGGAAPNCGGDCPGEQSCGYSLSSDGKPVGDCFCGHFINPLPIHSPSPEESEAPEVPEEIVEPEPSEE